MKNIFKYPLQITDEQTVVMPKESIILSAQYQEKEDTICLWAIVETPVLFRPQRNIVIIGTGNPIHKNLDTLALIGTAQMPNGLVFHVFEELSE